MRKKRFTIKDIRKNTNHHLRKLDVSFDWFEENSVMIEDNREIILGVYKNPKIKRWALLHELGHFLDVKKQPNKYEEEKEAWRIARLLAKHLGIKVGKHEIKYMRDCINSYKQKS